MVRTLEEVGNGAGIRARTDPGWCSVPSAPARTCSGPLPSSSGGRSPSSTSFSGFIDPPYHVGTFSIVRAVLVIAVTTLLGYVS